MYTKGLLQVAQANYHELEHAQIFLLPGYLHQEGIIFMTVCMLTGLSKYYCLEFHEKKSEDGSWSNLDPNKF